MANAIVPRGRRSELTQEVIELLCAEFQDGLSAVDACAVVGVNFHTYRRWLFAGHQIVQGNLKHPKIPEGEELQQLCVELAYRVPQAATSPRKNAMKTIVLHAKPKDDDTPGDLRAAFWVMEHTSPDYAQANAAQRHEIELTENHNVNVTVELDEEDVERAREVALILQQSGVTAQDIGLLPVGSGDGSGPGDGADPDEIVDGEFFSLDEGAEPAPSSGEPVSTSAADD